MNAFRNRRASLERTVLSVLVLTVPGCNSDFVKHYFGRGIDGPTFLVMYAAVFAVTFVAAIALRGIVSSSWIVTFTAVVLFLGCGVTRYVVGSQFGMRRFGILIGMMVVGTVVLLLTGRWSRPSSDASPPETVNNDDR